MKISRAMGIRSLLSGLLLLTSAVLLAFFVLKGFEGGFSGVMLSFLPFAGILIFYVVSSQKESFTLPRLGELAQTVSGWELTVLIIMGALFGLVTTFGALRFGFTESFFLILLFLSAGATIYFAASGRLIDALGIFFPAMVIGAFLEWRRMSVFLEVSSLFKYLTPTAIFIFILWLGYVRFRNSRTEVNPFPMKWQGILFISIPLLSLVSSAYSEEGFQYWLFQIAYPVSGFWLISSILTSERRVKKTVYWLILASSLYLLMGMYLFMRYEAVDLTSTTLLKYSLNHRFASANIDSCLIMVFPLLAYMFSVEKKRLYRIGFLILMTGAFFYIFFSASRSSWLGLLSVIVFLILKRTSRKQFIIFTLITLFLFMLGGGYALRVLDFNIPAVDELLRSGTYRGRIACWHAALEMFRERPVLGVGFGLFNEHYPLYGLPLIYNTDEGIVELWFAHAHNLYLGWLSETGLLGITVFFLMTGRIFLRGLRGFFGQFNGIRKGAFLGILGFLVFSLTEGIGYSQGTCFIAGWFFWTLAAIIMSPQYSQDGFERIQKEA